MFGFTAKLLQQVNPDAQAGIDFMLFLLAESQQPVPQSMTAHPAAGFLLITPHCRYLIPFVWLHQQPYCKFS